jgi:hypothetical protein
VNGSPSFCFAAWDCCTLVVVVTCIGSGVLGAEAVLGG